MVGSDFKESFQQIQNLFILTLNSYLMNKIKQNYFKIIQNTKEQHFVYYFVHY
jgi:hypothetical protein